jgi:TRAP-type C4-dicarboxylate transport system permease large subunit
MTQTLRLANRTGFEWLAAMPVFLVLIFVILLNTSHATHSQLLKLGENVWDGYFQLRFDLVQPSCEIEGNIDAQLARLIVENSASSAENEWGFFDDLEPVDTSLLRQSLVNARAVCEVRIQTYEQTLDRITPAVRAFRALELSIAGFGEFGLQAQRIMLAILVLICGMTALFRRHHIALRPMTTVMDYRVASFAQMIASGILFFSVYSFKEVVFNAGIVVSSEHGLLHYLWIAGFCAIFCLSIYQFIFIPKDAKPGGSFLKAQLSIPLYATMCIISGTYFIANGHTAGIGIYLNQMMELSQLFLNVGLYVWIGMLVKRTQMAQTVFNIFRPWNLPPEMLAVVVVVIAALPTAYTGASGIFVIAIGGLIYNELRRAGARRQLALAATAMSGSMGVVLRPCLLVVIISALNKEVTTDELFGWGLNVFLLTAVLFAAVAMLTKQGTLSIEKASVAWPETKKALWKLVPYGILIALTLAFYAIFLNAYLDEFSAPFILPVMLLVVLIYERMSQAKVGREKMDIDHIENRLENSGKDLKSGSYSIKKTLLEATTETTGHIGALLMLMGLSVSIGGVIERSHLMDLVPGSFESIWLAMGLLVVILVVVGMVMDPYGAVILVSATIATIAYESGIDPVHFWMVTLVAFELGYLSPPVALNHLLTRQVVGEKEVLLASQEGHNFWYRHEKYLLPLTVMGIALVIVAFVPLAIGYH